MRMNFTEELESIDREKISPIEALNTLYGMKKKLHRDREA
jgi:hypothetical protein